MASMQPQPPAPRRSSPEHSPANPSQPQSGSTPRSSGADDSPVVVENEPTLMQDREDAAPMSSSPPVLKRQDTDLKKCWICFADESEDTPETSRWRSPCPCALVAHEECLLDWIADLESPSKKRSIAPPQVLCPQCKSEIHLARPWDPLVESVRALATLSEKVVLPSAVVVGCETIRQAFVAHGMYSIVAIFGTDDARRILKPFLSSRLYEFNDFEARALELRDHWRLHLGLPLITPMLLLSRTSLADSVLPVLPIIFFATQGDAMSGAFSSEPVYWPPSASLTFAVLPYIRGAYNAYYQRVWGAHRLRWLKEVQPRLNQDTSDNNNNNDQAHADPANDDNVVAADGDVFEIRVDGNLWEDWEGNNNAPEADEQAAPLPQEEADNRAAIEAMVNGAADNDNNDEANPEEQQAHPLDAPPLDADAGPDVPLDALPPPPPPPEHVHPPAPPPQHPPAQPPGERRLAISTSGLAEKVLGALIFPTIASLSGELLRLVLPAAWTTSPVLARTWRVGNLGGRTKATGLLQEKWGRSVVGACLFVAVKDAVLLYVRWKMARDHRRRRVLDHDGRKRRTGKTVGA